ncbi:NAD-binding lipoprotein [Streptomyces sp. SID4948]|nr:MULTISPECIES: NAD-binding lipoprotein [unclassified Streptomyces]MYS24093.1 NAD-binding lipoprotein [Streptomyces sp. SID4948]
MARGTPALLGWVTSLCLLVVVPASAGLVWAGPHTPATRSAQLLAIWRRAGRTLRLGGAVGTPAYVLLSVLLALVTLLFVSTLVSLITSGLNQKIMALRLGRSTVLEERHTVLLGWSDQVFPIVSELVAANANRPKSVVAILSPKDKVGMEDELHTRVGRTGGTRVICRNGPVTDPDVLARVSPRTADAILVLLPGTDGEDAVVVKTLLALDAAVPGGDRPVVVAAVRDARHHLAASLAAGPRGRVLNMDEITARIIVQTSRQPGLSLVYQELLDFAGDEFYAVAEPALAGRTFGEALLAYATSSVVGLVRSGGAVLLNPGPHTVIRDDDRLVLITRDDDTAVLAGHPLRVDEAAITAPGPPAPAAERLLLLGWNRRAPMIVDQLDQYVGRGSRLDIVARGDEPVVHSATRHLDVRFHSGDIAEPHTFSGLDVPSYDRVIVLGHDRPTGEDPAASDVRTLVTLLHLRALEESTGRELSLVTEMSDDRNRLLAPVREGTDFIVSGRLISLLMTQISQNHHLADLFDQLFTPDGSEIYLKPAAAYVRPGRDVSYATVVESARRRHHCAIGYRLQAQAALGPSYGVRLNPDKRERVRLGAEDRVIVLAEQ